MAGLDGWVANGNGVRPWERRPQQWESAVIADMLLVATVALLASALTLFSGFGLGTLLMPALALVFPVPVAVAATAVVHLSNNLFKLLLVGRHADRGIVLRFGMPAGLAALGGAWLLGLLSGLPDVAAYELFGREHHISGVKLVIGALIVVFAVLDLSPGVSRLAFPSKYLVPGGLLSGFFGGLSGNQGALRAAFLIRAGLDKNAFVGTGVACSTIVDTLRIAVYGTSLLSADVARDFATLAPTVLVAIVAAFLGAVGGVRLLGKVTLRHVRLVVATMMVLVGSGLIGGLF